jgi:hypothetical protein
MPENTAVLKPQGLGKRGSQLWKSFSSSYAFRPDELIVVEQAARTLDTIGLLDEALSGQPLVVKGSMGQEREHPLLSEVRQQRAALARLLRQLDLPEEDAGYSAGSRSAAARSMARARWTRPARLANAPWNAS